MKRLVDTNIWVYAYDDTAGLRHDLAKKLLEDEISKRCLVCSCQVINETYSVLARKKGLPLRLVGIAVSVQMMLPVVDTDLDLIRTGINIGQKYQMSHWDALIIAAAICGGCAQVLSEDLQHGQIIEGVEIFNPFLELD
jgi:predicted nucleic acid-binding protein